MWKIFEYPCGARLASILSVDTASLRSATQVPCFFEFERPIFFEKGNDLLIKLDEWILSLQNIICYLRKRAEMA